MLGGGLFSVGVAVRLARLADTWIGDSGVTALAAALPQMPSLTTLYLRGTATRARCGLPVVGARASVVGRQLAPCASVCGCVVGCRAAGFFGSELQCGLRGSQATRSETRALLRWRRRCRRCRASRRSISAVRPRVRVAGFPVVGARASVGGRQLTPCALAMRARGLMLVGGPCGVGVAVRLARLADNQIGDSGVTALAAALPQMPSLTTLDVSSTATRARCGLPVVGARASVVGRQLVSWALAKRARGWM
jgi:hypothetical protein